jgi:hypothetical protein
VKTLFSSSDSKIPDAQARSERVRGRLDHRKVEAAEVCRRIEVLTKVIWTSKLSFAYKRKRDDSRKGAKNAKFGESEDILNFAPLASRRDKCSWICNAGTPAYANSIPATVLKF